jgi:hypothetical protein
VNAFQANRAEHREKKDEDRACERALGLDSVRMEHRGDQARKDDERE